MLSIGRGNNNRCFQNPGIAKIGFLKTYFGLRKPSLKRGKYWDFVPKGREGFERILSFIPNLPSPCKKKPKHKEHAR